MTAGSITVPTIIPLRAPGRSKSSIDTDTAIEISTDTPGTVIFYTIDGTRPDPFQKLGEKTTLRYREPFQLPEGKKIVKAIAYSNDGMKESNLVSKNFVVEHTYREDEEQDSDDSYTGIVTKKPALKTTTKVTSNLMQKILEEKNTSVFDKLTISQSGGGGHRKPPRGGPRFMDSRLGGARTPDTPKQRTSAASPSPSNRPPSAKPPSGKTSLSLTANRPRNAPENVTQANRLQRETDFLKCIFCLADRPADPYARFCGECGSPIPPLPNTQLPPPEPGQMGVCVGCNSVVPLNASHCLVCETPMAPQNVPQAHVKLKDKLVCGSCGTANPVNLKYCVTCENRLPAQPTPLFAGNSAPPKPSPEGRLLCCNKCGRVNNSDARFCDWCGEKPAPPTSHLVCSKCGGSNHPYAKYCYSCGCLIEPPSRSDPRNSRQTTAGMSSSLIARAGSSTPPATTASWLPISLPSQAVIKKSTATQTVGLFYPSNKQLERKGQAEVDAKSMHSTMSDKRPPVTAVSPGKGYWRQQMEHVCGHLKAYAQNNKQFQALIGEPRMGKIVSATVHEDGYELSVGACFALRGNKDTFTGKPMGLSQGGGANLLSQVTEDRRSAFGSTSSLDSVGRHSSRGVSKKGGQQAKKKVVKRKANPNEELTLEDRLLFKEVGPNGQGRDHEIERLIDEGASANAVNGDEVPVLTVAVRNQHLDAVQALVSLGADLNKKAGTKGNTALHEAVELGLDGEKLVRRLLDCGASANKKNDKGDSAYDLAVRSKVDQLVTCFASSMGQGMMEKFSKIKTVHGASDPLI